VTLYVPSHFRVEDPKELDAFIAQNAFGTLVSSGDSGLHASHIPFVAARGADGTLRLGFHLARANPQAAALGEARHVLAIFQGAHGYVSPTWYENHPAVPTWNYAVVHAQGRVEPMDEPGLRGLVGQLSSHYESGRPQPWDDGEDAARLHREAPSRDHGFHPRRRAPRRQVQAFAEPAGPRSGTRDRSPRIRWRARARRPDARPSAAPLKGKIQP
jgi:transcriptional regulator